MAASRSRKFDLIMRGGHAVDPMAGRSAMTIGGFRKFIVEAAMTADAECRVIPSVYGHFAAAGANPDDDALVDAALGELLRTKA